MNSHDELSYIKIITRIIEEMSKENDKIKREMMIHRLIIIFQTVIIIAILMMGAK